MRAAPSYDMFNGAGAGAPLSPFVPIASDFTLSQSSAPPTGSPRRWAIPSATSSPRSSTTSAGPCSPGCIPATPSASTDGGTPDDRIDRGAPRTGHRPRAGRRLLTRRWGVHAHIAEAVERHHSKEADGPSAIVRLADMVVAYIEDTPVSVTAMIESADASALGEDGLRKLSTTSPGRGHFAGPRARVRSRRELDVLRRLAEGKVYKQIAVELDLSASTVRSHLHNVYGKLGALDRAQAVLMATEQGWIWRLLLSRRPSLHRQGKAGVPASGPRRRGPSRSRPPRRRPGSRPAATKVWWSSSVHA